ncbi:hypothetical protein [Clostridium thermosuccinogenes]|nr:hypothetical protein [Pseudoclostridium thermosuccinogenes]
MGDKMKKKNNTKQEPTFDNDQLGENASEEFAQDYMQKGRTAKKKKK